VEDNTEISNSVDCLISQFMVENVLYNRMTSGQVPNKMANQFHDWVNGAPASDLVVRELRVVKGKYANSPEESVKSVMVADIIDGLRVNGYEVLYSDVDRAVEVLYPVL
jgi:hypothetical protein